jgi:hypothetical protein
MFVLGRFLQEARRSGESFSKQNKLRICSEKRNQSTKRPERLTAETAEPAERLGILYAPGALCGERLLDTEPPSRFHDSG